MEANESVDFWLRSGWNSAAAILTIATTIIGMWLGTIAHPTPQDEKERVEEFFADLEKPYEYDEAADTSGISPFRIIGLVILLLGCVMAVIAVLVWILYQDTTAFGIDLIVGIVMAVLGLIMRYGGRQKSVEA